MIVEQQKETSCAESSETLKLFFLCDLMIAPIPSSCFYLYQTSNTCGQTVAVSQVMFWTRRGRLYAQEDSCGLRSRLDEGPGLNAATGENRRRQIAFQRVDSMLTAFFGLALRTKTWPPAEEPPHTHTHREKKQPNIPLSQLKLDV